MTQTRDHYDLIVIGAGPGGYEAAIRAAQLGKKTGLIEGRQVGGTCLNRGCIPTKALMHTVHLFQEMCTCEELGIHGENVAVDFGGLHRRKNQVVNRLRDGILQLLKANKITLLQGCGRLEGRGAVRVVKEDGEICSVTADKILIATGSVPSLPPIPGLELEGVVTSDAVLEGEGLDSEKLIIIGGGVIGIELASVYAGLGRKVTVIEAAEQILPNLEKELSRSMAMILKKKGVKIHTAASVKKVEKAESGRELAVVFEEKGKEGREVGDSVLVSTGRKANIEGLFKGKPPLETERGAIVVDESFETTMEGVYAIGDVVFGNIQLAHAASAQGIHAVCRMFGEHSDTNLSLIPSCIYTSPEVATVGMNLEQAKKAGIEAKECKFLMTANGKSLISREERSFIKVTYSQETKKILGAAMMCARATDMISEFSIAIAKGLTLEDMASIVRPHPTYAEGITEAVEAGLGGGIHSAPPLRK